MLPQNSGNWRNFAALTPKKAILKAGREGSVLRGHPWIFSGAIQQADPCEVGDWVEVYAKNGDYLGAGHAGNGSIAIRLLTHVSEKPDAAFWKDRLQNCRALRQRLGLGFDRPTNAYRLVHGEGDRLPGLIIDMYNTCAVIQAHSHGMYFALQEISTALQEVMGNRLSTIYSKSRSALHEEQATDGWLLGDETGTIAMENGVPFHVNWESGQKTGFFLDQRENRQLLMHYAAGREVLNTFCYTGGFSVFALKGGATRVHSVDISEKAVALAAENVALNGLESWHSVQAADVMEYLKEPEQLWDIAVLDPPAFAKNLSKKHQAVMGYKRLNTLGLKAVKPGGLLFTFSCSQVIDDVLFANTVTAAGIEAGRQVRILHRLSQGPDHPVNLYHPEGHYLKGLVLEVE
ncbi:MAG: class I SAM-dependent rRNA methyltransferase [Bacteroidetes bacterium]|nr:class I SAM-dependent rRNA methyltransferase [Bacteroidota bacterium]